jgi:hypothetical protein
MPSGRPRSRSQKVRLTGSSASQARSRSSLYRSEVLGRRAHRHAESRARKRGRVHCNRSEPTLWTAVTARLARSLPNFSPIQQNFAQERSLAFPRRIMLPPIPTLLKLGQRVKSGSSPVANIRFSRWNSRRLDHRMAPVSQAKKILYRGVPMIESWPEKIAAAQNLQSYTLSGQTIPRIRYGSEDADWGADKHACRDCAVLKGEFHVPGCDGEECPVCHFQLLSCKCSFFEREDLRFYRA